MAELDFTANENWEDDNKSDFDKLPEAWYLVECVKLEWKLSKNQNKMLSARLAILDGDFKGRLIFANYNLKHPTQKAAEIAATQFSGFCVSCGVKSPSDTDELLEIPFGVRLKYNKAGYENCVNYCTAQDYEARAKAEPAKAAPVTEKTESGSGSGTTKKDEPWLNK